MLGNLVKIGNGRHFVIGVFFVPTNCLFFSHLSIHENSTWCEAIMFHVLASWVWFDYVINNENIRDFVIKDFIVPTNGVLLSHPISEVVLGPYKLCIV